MPLPTSTLRLPTRSFVVIPARLASTRLPRKMLLRKTGKSLVRHTYEAACQAKKPLGVCVATDDIAIANEVRSFGGRVIMTSAECASGTDRVAEAAAELASADILINVQGDEPEIDPAAIDRVIACLEANPSAPMATLATPIRCQEKLDAPSCVKVVFDKSGKALYFSRSAIPHRAASDFIDWNAPSPLYHQHIGVYAYRRQFLQSIAQYPQTPLEIAERLEQLRVLQAGVPIAVATVHHAASGIDTPADYEAFVERYRACGIRRAG